MGVCLKKDELAFEILESLFLLSTSCPVSGGYGNGPIACTAVKRWTKYKNTSFYINARLTTAGSDDLNGQGSMDIPYFHFCIMSHQPC